MVLSLATSVHNVRHVLLPRRPLRIQQEHCRCLRAQVAAPSRCARCVFLLAVSAHIVSSRSSRPFARVRGKSRLRVMVLTRQCLHSTRGGRLCVCPRWSCVFSRCLCPAIIAESAARNCSHLQGIRERPHSFPASLQDARLVPLGIRTHSLRRSRPPHRRLVRHERHELPHPRWPPRCEPGHAQSHWRTSTLSLFQLLSLCRMLSCCRTSATTHSAVERDVVSHVIVSA